MRRVLHIKKTDHKHVYTKRQKVRGQSIWSWPAWKAEVWRQGGDTFHRPLSNLGCHPQRHREPLGCSEQTCDGTFILIGLHEAQDPIGMLGSCLLQAEAFLPRGKKEAQDSGANLTSKAQELNQLWNPHRSPLRKNSTTCCREETLSIELLASHTAWLKVQLPWVQACENRRLAALTPLSLPMLINVTFRPCAWKEPQLSHWIAELDQDNQHSSAAWEGVDVLTPGVLCTSWWLLWEEQSAFFKFAALGRPGALKRIGLHLWRTASTNSSWSGT